jgi:hypothetical protein
VFQQRNGVTAPIADVDDDGLDDPVTLSKRPTATHVDKVVLW